VERDKAVRLVNDALSREYNSVSEYVLHSSPYAVPGDAPALKAFEEIRDRQAATASWLTTRLREDLGAGPTLRAFQYWDRDLNYLSVPYLVRFAVEHYRKATAEYDALLKEVGDDAALKAVFTRLRDEQKAHAAALEKFVPAWKEPPKEGPPAPA
jgi:bacterioferritin (cytochrome b1)